MLSKRLRRLILASGRTETLTDRRTDTARNMASDDYLAKEEARLAGAINRKPSAKSFAPKVCPQRSYVAPWLLSVCAAACCCCESRIR